MKLEKKCAVALTRSPIAAAAVRMLLLFTFHFCGINSNFNSRVGSKCFKLGRGEGDAARRHPCGICIWNQIKGRQYVKGKVPRWEDECIQVSEPSFEL